MPLPVRSVARRLQRVQWTHNAHRPFVEHVGVDHHREPRANRKQPERSPLASGDLG